MRIRTVLFFSAVVFLCVIGARAATDTTAVQTIVNNIKANTEKITSFYAAFTLREDSLKADGTDTCLPRNESLTYGKGMPDTVVFSVQQDTGWISNNSQTGTDPIGVQLPTYQDIFMLNILSDTFPNSWINPSIPTFTAKVVYEDNDSIVLNHMNSSVSFAYTVDKSRWVVTHINAGGYDVYDAIYTWSKSSNGIYYPSAITISQAAAICSTKYAFTSVKLNGTAMTPVLPRGGKASAVRSNTVSVALTQAPGEKVVISVPYGENIRDVSITDASGRLVQLFAGKGTAASGRTLLWDGKDLFSQAVRAGVYFATVTTDRGRVSARLPLVK
jgi:hypothetical protein